MESQIYSRVVTIVNASGLHARPADKLVKLATQYKCRLEIIKGHERVDGRSIISLLTLAAEKGTELTLEGNGEDAQAAVDAMAELIARSFDEDKDQD
jgi:phosphotransferase system HPr (HPr) family protein